MDRDLVITSNEVYLREYRFSGKVRREVVNPGYGVSIEIGGFIESSEITTGSPPSPGFRSDVKR